MLLRCLSRFRVPAALLGTDGASLQHQSSAVFSRAAAGRHPGAGSSADSAHGRAAEGRLDVAALFQMAPQWHQGTVAPRALKNN